MCLFARTALVLLCGLYQAVLNREMSSGACHQLRGEVRLDPSTNLLLHLLLTLVAQMPSRADVCCLFCLCFFDPTAGFQPSSKGDMEILKVVTREWEERKANGGSEEPFAEP